MQIAYPSRRRRWRRFVRSCSYVWLPWLSLPVKPWPGSLIVSATRFRARSSDHHCSHPCVRVCVGNYVGSLQDGPPTQPVEMRTGSRQHRRCATEAGARQSGTPTSREPWDRASRSVDGRGCRPRVTEPAPRGRATARPLVLSSSANRRLNSRRGGGLSLSERGHAEPEDVGKVTASLAKLRNRESPGAGTTSECLCGKASCYPDARAISRITVAGLGSVTWTGETVRTDSSAYANNGEAGHRARASSAALCSVRDAPASV